MTSTSSTGRCCWPYLAIYDIYSRYIYACIINYHSLPCRTWISQNHQNPSAKPFPPWSSGSCVLINPPSRANAPEMPPGWGKLVKVGGSNKELLCRGLATAAAYQTIVCKFIPQPSTTIESSGAYPFARCYSNLVISWNLPGNGRNQVLLFSAVHSTKMQPAAPWHLFSAERLIDETSTFKDFEFNLIGSPWMKSTTFELTTSVCDIPWYPHVSLPAMKNPSFSIFNNEDIRECVLFHELPWQCLATEGYLARGSYIMIPYIIYPSRFSHGKGGGKCQQDTLCPFNVQCPFFTSGIPILSAIPHNKSCEIAA